MRRDPVRFAAATAARLAATVAARVLLATAGWLLGAGAVASGNGLLEGDLGRWVDQAGPKLGQTLSRHPRFKGETVRLVTVTPGQPDGVSNELANAVARRLREHLLQAGGVRLAVNETRRDCEPPRPIDYVVRVEVANAGGREGRVHIAVVDVAESVWVSGISYQWRGRLSQAEQRALADTVHGGGAGTASSPIPLTDADAVAVAMADELACTLPRNLTGTLFVAPPDASALSPVALALQNVLSYRPVGAITRHRAQATWVLSLDMDDAGAGMGELHLALTDAASGSRQRLAAVFVTGAPGTDAVATAPGASERAAPTPGTAPAVSAAKADAAGLLSSLTLRAADSQGLCDARVARVNTCVDVGFELRRPAYLFVVTTRGHRVVDAPCQGGLQRSVPGPHHYRLRVPPGSYAVNGSGPDAGIYVLAARDRGVAAAIQDVLARTPGRCEPAPDGEPGAWLEALRRVLARHTGDVAWRAMQLAHDTGGVVAL